MSTVDLSVVVPAFNEAERLPRTLARLTAYLKDWGRSYEILVVDDGSRDETVARAREHPGVGVVANEGNRGKGYSVRRGMLLARGERRLMTDADLSTPIEELPRFLARMDEGGDVVIGSRAVPGARVEVHQTWPRENAGRLFNLFVRLLLLPGVRDTQCGFKLFTAAAAGVAFGESRLNGFSFDVEALYIAQRRGFLVVELPVTWRNDAASRVGLGQGALAFFDLLRIRGNAWRGLYGL